MAKTIGTSPEQLEPVIDVKALEDEVMGGSGGGSQAMENLKSYTMERNLQQMVEVLHLRLNAIKTGFDLRNTMCEWDIDAKETRVSYFNKITDDYEDMNPKSSAKDGVKTSDVNISQKSSYNLVSAEGIYVDPVKLVLKTKGVTETAKRLEVKLDETFGLPNMRDTKGKRSKGSKGITSKKSMQQLLEAKRQLRIRIEKELQNNIENFVTRSVMVSNIHY